MIDIANGCLRQGLWLDVPKPTVATVSDDRSGSASPDSSLISCPSAVGSAGPVRMAVG